jgi:putative membrane protein
MKSTPIPALAGAFALALGASVLCAQAAPVQDNPAPTGGTPAGRTAPQPSAQTPGTAPTATAGSTDTGVAVVVSDKAFVKKAMQGSMAEIQLGQLAQQKASSDDVKQFGQKMVDDHTKLSDQMKPIASQLGVNPPTELSGKDKALQKKLEGLSGDAFDKAYMSAMVKDHQKDLNEFEQASTSAKSPQVQQAAQQGAQVIHEHLQLAQQVAEKVGAKGGKTHNEKATNSSSNPQ